MILLDIGNMSITANTKHFKQLFVGAGKRSSTEDSTTLNWTENTLSPDSTQDLDAIWGQKQWIFQMAATIKKKRKI